MRQLQSPRFLAVDQVLQELLVRRQRSVMEPSSMS
jgi:hypothetical protein